MIKNISDNSHPETPGLVYAIYGVSLAIKQRMGQLAPLLDELLDREEAKRGVHE